MQHHCRPPKALHHGLFTPFQHKFEQIIEIGIGLSRATYARPLPDVNFNLLMFRSTICHVCLYPNHGNPELAETKVALPSEVIVNEAIFKEDLILRTCELARLQFHVSDRPMPVLTARFAVCALTSATALACSVEEILAY